MFKQTIGILVLSLSLIFWHCTNKSSEDLKLRDNMIIRKSVSIDSATYSFHRVDSMKGPVVYIQGKHIDIDFNHATLIGNVENTRPDLFLGTAIIIEKGHHITIRNLKIRGYKNAIIAKDVDHLHLINCDFSYNFRQQLGSTREREDLSDWLSHHTNENDEWLRYGAAVYLKNCDNATVRDVKIMQGQNGLLMVQSDSGLIYSNNIQFNSGLGIGLYRSSNNKIMHNRLDFNVRGYSHGIYKRGQDSAGILLYEQSDSNIIAYNSATHSGDGLFLWAGNHTMDSGEGGCNHNLIYKNDFSFAPTNGIEVTFSQNLLVENTMQECRYGIWGGYSYKTLMEKNNIKNCDFGIAIEHGNNNDIIENNITNTAIGIQLWERKTQPTDWGFSQKRNISSRNYQIIGNHFKEVAVPTDIKHTANVTISNNVFEGANKSSSKLANSVPISSSYTDEKKYARPKKIPDVRLPKMFNAQIEGRKYIIVNQWGPYNFSYPLIWLREINNNEYIFALFGPEGNWRVVQSEGFEKLSLMSGNFPNSIKAMSNPTEDIKRINLEFIGEAFTDQFGKSHHRGQVFEFSYLEFKDPLVWDTYFYKYQSELLPIADSLSFKKIISDNYLAHIKSEELAYTWWSAPHEKITADKFISISRSSGGFSEGNYRITLISDDGARLFIDKKLILSDWNIHTPRRKIKTVPLNGQHDFIIEHFDEGGLANLDFRIEKIVNE